MIMFCFYKGGINFTLKKGKNQLTIYKERVLVQSKLNLLVTEDHFVQHTGGADFRLSGGSSKRSYVYAEVRL